MSEKLHYEKPAILKIEKEADYVYEQFDKVGFKIKEFPELHERLVELANMPDSHFDDAVKMAEIVEVLWPFLEQETGLELNKDQLKLACLFHDIGKSGPVGASQEQRLMIEQIFNPIYFDIDSPNFQNAPQFKGKSMKEQKALMKDLTINEILEIENFPNNEEIRQYLQTLTIHTYHVEKNGIRKEAEPLDLNKHSMIQLWREHDQWTYDLLDKNFKELKKKDKSIEQLIIVASTHHTLEGHDPANVRDKVPEAANALETIDKYLIITLVDKYQAFIDREKVDHDTAIKILRKMVDDSRDSKIINHEGKTYEIFSKYISILEDHSEIADIVKPPKK